MKTKIPAILALLGLMGAAPVPPPAAASAAPLACDGQIAILYHSKIVFFF